MIRLVIADDHPIVRAGLVGLLDDEPGFEVVGQAADGAAAVEVVEETKPDVVLMDLRMPVLDGVGATTRLVQSGSSARILILTTYESDDQILAAIEAGASGYLLKAAPQDEIVAGIRSVAEGQTALSPQVAVRLVERMRQPAAQALSERELDVLRLVRDGRSNKQIAVALGIGESTVKTHLLRMFEKLGVSDRTRAVTLAMERGLIT
ncbi:response regulator [Microbacterium sp. bgisy189]|uniref:response regulator n=1 Tax=Microbacterium sp. bgisy189 TaxID=3413798 RepID=UPI003EBB6A5E